MATPGQRRDLGPGLGEAERQSQVALRVHAHTPHPNRETEAPRGSRTPCPSFSLPVRKSRVDLCERQGGSLTWARPGCAGLSASAGQCLEPMKTNQQDLMAEGSSNSQEVEGFLKSFLLFILPMPGTREIGRHTWRLYIRSRWRAGHGGSCL